MRFYYVYKSITHPETNGYVQPFTLEERLRHVSEAKLTLGTKMPWLCDTMENDLKHALGGAPNSEFVIDPQGIIVRRRMWCDPAQLRTDLEELVGAVDTPTTPESLHLKALPPPQAAARGVVQRVVRPRGMTALRIEPLPSADGLPFYAKLRVEANASLLRGGSGTLYLGFHLDPLYEVHWNNLTSPIRIELTAPETWNLERLLLEGPKVAAESDIDPREFLVQVSQASGEKPLEVKAVYFACNDQEGWCKRVEQSYRVHLEADRDAGWTKSRELQGDGTPRRKRPQ